LRPTGSYLTRGCTVWGSIKKITTDTQDPALSGSSVDRTLTYINFVQSPNKRTRQFNDGKRIKAFQSFSHQAEKRLRILDAADKIEDLRLLPSNRFEA